MRRAFGYGTIIPLAPAAGVGRPIEHLAWVLVAVLVGAVWIVVGRGATVLLGPAVAAGAVVLADAWVTRALHLDGLAALVDGVASGEDPEDVVAVAREPGLRAAGLAALLGVSLVRFGALVPLVFPPGELVLGLVPAGALALLAAPAAGRLAMVTCWWRAPLRDDEPEDSGFPRPTWPMVVGLAIATLLVSAAAGPVAVGAVLVGLTVGAVVAWWWQARYGSLIAEVPAGACLVAETLTLLLVVRALVS